MPALWRLVFARWVEARAPELQRVWPLFASRAQGVRQAHGARSDVVMSGFVDSGRHSGHGNIDANDPEPTCAVQNFCSANRRFAPYIDGRKFLL
jgi:hypothetical protein